MGSKTHPTRRIDTDLTTIRGGKVVEMVNAELKRLAADILDLNKPPKETRKLTLELTFKPSEGRVEVAVTAKTTLKLATRRPLEAVCVMTEDDKGNAKIAEQLNIEDLDSLRPRNALDEAARALVRAGATSVSVTTSATGEVVSTDPRQTAFNDPDA